MSAGVEVLVRCTGLCCRLGGGPGAVHALREVDCTIHAGEVIALRGPSGSGKSTLLHLIAGIAAPTAGALDWPGLRTRPPHPAQVGLVFQEPNLLPDLDVLQNTVVPMLLAGIPAVVAYTRATDSLELLGLGELSARWPGEVSAGQAHRVAMARALAARPRLILADEPTGRLDTHTARQVLDTLITIRDATGAAVLIATHDAAVAARADTQWLLHDGTLSTRTAEQTTATARQVTR